jgi:hypothetical protein
MPESHVKGLFQPHLAMGRQLLTVWSIGPFTMQIRVDDANFAFKTLVLRSRLQTNLFADRQTEFFAAQSITF